MQNRLNEMSQAGQFLSVSEACREIRAGQPVLLYDDQQPQMLTICQAAQFATPASISFLREHTHSGLYAALSSTRLDTLLLAPLVMPTDPFSSLMTSPREYQPLPLQSVAQTLDLLHTLANPASKPTDIVPLYQLSCLRPHPGGILQHRGTVEAAIDLFNIAGVEPVAVLAQSACDYPDGEAYSTTATVTPISDSVSTLTQSDAAPVDPLATILAQAVQWQLGVLSLSTLVRYRKEHRLSFVSEVQFPTPFATFRLCHFQDIQTSEPYLALLLGDLQSGEQDPPLLRLHSACATGDIFGSQRCDCQAQLHAAMQAIATAGRGILIYLPQEGRGIGLSAKLQAYALQELGADTIEANELLGYPVDARDYTCATEMLRELGITHARLLTNNPDKVQALQTAGLTIERVSLETPPTVSNLHYLQTKQQQFGHLLSLQIP